MEQAFLIGLSLVGLATFGEILARFLYFLRYRKSYRGGHLRDHSAAQPLSNGSQESDAEVAERFIAHPYVGYVHNPAAPRLKSGAGLGWDSKTSPILKRHPGTLNVLLLGGSVAQQLNPSLGKELESVLRRKGVGKVEVKLALGALGGFQQPQQINSAVFFLCLGAEYDLIINLDGLGQLRAGFTSPARGCHPVMPSAWISLAREAASARNPGRLRHITDARYRIARGVELTRNPFVCRSAFAGLCLLAFLKWSKARLERLETAPSPEAAALAENLRTISPEWRPDDAGDQLESVEIWRRASLLLQGIANGADADYLHVLQPSQYAEGSSKPLSDSERKQAHDPERRIAQAVATSYPRLAAAGRELRRQGVAFVDGREFFAGDERSLYKDPFGHFTPEGVEALAREIAKAAVAHCPRLRARLTADRRPA